MVSSGRESQFIRDGIDLRVLARRQRQVIWLSAASLLIFMAQYPLLVFVPAFRLPRMIVWIIACAYFGLQFTVIVGTVLLARALGRRWYLLPVLAVIMVIPMVNLIVLLLENKKATSKLKKAGLDVGFWGASDEIVVRRLSAELCAKCGYNLTGNVSGICPECGQVIRNPAPLGAS